MADPDYVDALYGMWRQKNNQPMMMPSPVPADAYMENYSDATMMRMPQWLRDKIEAKRMLMLRKYIGENSMHNIRGNMMSVSGRGPGVLGQSDYEQLFDEQILPEITLDPTDAQVAENMPNDLSPGMSYTRDPVQYKPGKYMWLDTYNQNGSVRNPMDVWKLLAAPRTR